KVERIAGASRTTQVPENVTPRNVPDPLLMTFTEQQIEEVDMLVRLSPQAALKTATLTVFYESFKKAGPFGPDLKVPHKVKLKPAHYSLEAAATGYELKRTDPIRHPGQPFDLELLLAAANPTAAAPSSSFISFYSRDPMVMIGVTGPGGFRDAATGAVYIPK